jgi:dihydrofolate reductase
MRVFIIAALSADGFIAQNASHSSLDWRSKEDGATFGTLTKAAGVIVMGETTYQTFRLKRAPPGRRLIVYSYHPERIIGEGVEATDEDPQNLVKRLSDEGYPALAVGGGATINKLFMDCGLVDELYLTVEPVLFGQGITLFNAPLQARLKLLETKQLNSDTLLQHYQVVR